MYNTNGIKKGTYLFSVYAWKYEGINTYSKLVTICENEKISLELPSILNSSVNISETTNDDKYDWSSLEKKQICLWDEARNKHKKEMNSAVTFKLESLANTYRNRIRSLEQKMTDAYDESIQRMRTSEIEAVQESYNIRVDEIKANIVKADIYTTLLANGIIIVEEE